MGKMMVRTSTVSHDYMKALIIRDRRRNHITRALQRTAFWRLKLESIVALMFTFLLIRSWLSAVSELRR